MNLLRNSSFEAGWTDSTSVPNQQIPSEWDWWFAGPDVPNPYYDGNPWSKFVSPEMVHIYKAQVPEHERDLFWWAGDVTLKIFKGAGAWRGRLCQGVGVGAGIYKLSVPVYPDAVSSYVGGKTAAPDPDSAQIRSYKRNFMQEEFGDWMTMQPFLQRRLFEFTFVIPKGESTRQYFGVEFLFPHALANSGMFTDGWSFERVEEPEPEPVPCRGAPREQYKRVYNLIHPNVTREEFLSVAETVYGSRGTIGFSADDAGIGDLDEREVVAWKFPPEEYDDYKAFFVDYYPGVTIEFFEEGEPTEPPEPAPERPNISGWLGVHQLAVKPTGCDDINSTGPAAYKTVDRIDLLVDAIGHVPPEMETRFFYRKWHADEGGASFRYNPDKRAAAEEWVRITAGDLTASGIHRLAESDRVYVLSINEVWDYSMENNRHSIEFDLEFIKALERHNQMHGAHYRPVASSMAVGNPALPEENEEQWQEIVPLAKAIRDAGGVMNYHGYGLCVPDHPEYLEMDSYGMYLQHRWMAYYDWLKANGVIVPWFLGEGGHVGGSVTQNNAYYVNTVTNEAIPYMVATPSGNVILRKRQELFPPPGYEGLAANNMWLNPGQGWKGLIGIDRLIKELIDYFNNPIEAKNQIEGWQACVGGTPFQAGNTTDWAKFDLQGDPLRLLAKEYRAREW